MKKGIALICCIFYLINSSISQSLFTSKVDWKEEPEQITINPNFESAHAIILKDERIWDFSYPAGSKKNLSCEYSFHRLIQVNDDRAIESFNKLYLPLRKNSELLEIKARTISKNGLVKNLNQADLKELENKEGQGIYKIYAFEGLEKGGRLEVYYKISREVEYAFRTVTQSSIPVQSQTTKIICPSNLTFIHKTYNGQTTDIDSVIEEKRFAIVSATNVKGIDEEKYSSYSAEMLRTEFQLAYNSIMGKERVLSYSTLAERNYESLYEANEKLYSKTAKQIIKLSKKKNLTHSDQEEKIRYIENYIKTNYQITNDNIPGLSDVPTILKTKICNLLGISRLFVYFFRVNEVNFDVVITCDRTEYPFDKDFESWNYINDFLFYFPDSKKFLTPNGINFRYPNIPSVYELNYGLFLKELKLGSRKSVYAKVKPIPAKTLEDNYDVLEANCQFSKEMDSLYIDLKRVEAGSMGTNNRFVNYYAQPEDRKKIRESILKQSMKDARILTSEAKNEDFLSTEPFEVSGKIGGSALIEKSGNDVVLKVGDIIGAQVEMYQEKQRELNIDMVYSHQYKRTIRIKIPDGFKVSGLETLNMNIQFNDADGKDAAGFKSTYAIKDKVITINATEYYKSIQLPKSKYDDFVKVINAAADFNKINLLFEKE